MVKNPEFLEQIELEYEREHPLTLEQKFDLFEQMYQLTLELGQAHLSKHDESLEEIVSLAKALHGNISTTPGTHRASAGKG